LAAEQDALLAEAFPWPSLRKKMVNVQTCQEQPNREERYRVKGFTFNIDPPGCRDIDDCISIAEGDISDKWEIAITIADVAERIEELGALDLLAATFGQTVYRDGEAICPMLPPSISEEACSLIAGQDRYGISLILTGVETEAGFRIVGRRWAETVIHNDVSFTYDNFYTRADASVYRVLQSVAELCGARSGGNTHDWIEALMLEYNREAGELLAQAGCGILRRHTAADMEKMEILAPFGLQALAQQSAEYCLVGEQGVRHWGIGADHYAHASSPLRRYADLMNQRLIKQIIRAGAGTQVDGLMVTVDVGDLNMRGRAVKQYEKRCALIRDLLDARREGRHIYDGIVVDSGRIWITDLKCLLKIYCGESTIGTRVRVEIGINLQGLRWADRIVRRIVS
jgi:exoribonuclease R